MFARGGQAMGEARPHFIVRRGDAIGMETHHHGGGRSPMSPSKLLSDDKAMEYWQILFEDLSKENDRTFIIVGATFLELLLERLIRNFLVDDKEKIGNLLHSESLAGTLYAKTELAYLLGLLTDLEYDDLGVIRRLRNAFAHEIDADLDGTALGGNSRPENLQLPKHLISDGRPNQRSRVLFAMVQLANRLEMHRLNLDPCERRTRAIEPHVIHY